MMSGSGDWKPTFADGGPRKRKAKAGWDEWGQLGWTVMIGERIASVNDIAGDFGVHCGYSDKGGYEPAFSIPVSTPSQLLDAMIRADRWVAGEFE